MGIPSVSAIINEAKVIEFLNNRTFAVVAGVLLALTAALTVATGQAMPADVGQGMFFSISKALYDSTWLSMVVNVAGILATGVQLTLLGKLYNFVKSLTFVGAAAFFLLELSTPLISCTLNTGTLLVLLLAVGTMELFDCYQDKHAQGPIFLVMCVLGFGVMVHWAALVLIPAFLLGFAYLRAMNWRAMVAAAIGLFTPFWIVLGLGIASPSEFRLLELNPLWDTLEQLQVRLLVGWAACTVLMTIVLSVVNLFSIYHYRLQLRVYNAFFLMVSFLAVAAMCVDHRNLTAYLPIVNLCLSVQIAHAFTISKFPKRYLFIVALAVVCVGVCISSIVI